MTTRAPFLTATLTMLALIATGCRQAASEGGVASDGPESVIAAAGGHDHEGEASDLDRSIDQLMAESCEHDVATYTCPECRYELGMVEIADRLLDPTDGILRTVTTGATGRLSGQVLNGEVRLDEARAVHLAPLASGVVRAISVDVGQRVQQGQVLFEVASGELREVVATYRKALAAEALAAAAAARDRDLHVRGVCPLRDVQEAEAALAQAGAERQATAGALLSLGLTEGDLDHLVDDPSPYASGLMRVRAPFAGTVLERTLSLGAIVEPGQGVLLIADTSRVWVVTTLPERDLAALLRAQRKAPVTAEVAVAAYPERTFQGAVAVVGGTLDETTRAARARVVVDNRDGLLRAGMFARVWLQTGAAPTSLTVPREAVLEDEGRQFVFVRLQGSLFVRRPVSTGRESGDWVEVVTGLDPGQELVTTGAFLLKSDVLRAKMGAGCAD